MADVKNRSAEQLLSDLHQKRLQQALDEFSEDKTRMAVGRLLEEYVDDGGKSYFDGKKDETLCLADDDEYIEQVSSIEPKDDESEASKENRKGGFFAEALSKLAEKLKTEEPEDFEDEFGDDSENGEDESEADADLADGTSKGFEMPVEGLDDGLDEGLDDGLNEASKEEASRESTDSAAGIEEEESVPPVSPGIFDTAKLSGADISDIEERLERVNLKPAVMDFADPDEVLKEILGDIEPKAEKTKVQGESSEGAKKEKKAEKTDSLDDIPDDELQLGDLVDEIVKSENDGDIEEAPKAEEKEEAPEAEESTITVTSVPAENESEGSVDMSDAEGYSKEDYPTKFKEKDNNKNTYVAEKTVVLDKPLIGPEQTAEDKAADDAQPLSQEDEDMTKEEEVLDAIKTETEAEAEEYIPSRRRRFAEEKKNKKKKKFVEEPVEEDIDDIEADESDTDDLEEEKPKKGLFGFGKKKKKKDEEYDESEEEIEDEYDEEYDEDEDYDDEDDYEDYDDEYYGKSSPVKKFFIGALFVILVVAVTALAAMCYSYKSQLDSTRAQLSKLTGGETEETTAVVVEDTTLAPTTEVTTQAQTEATTQAAVSAGNTQAVQIVNGDGTASNATGATASGTTYTVKSGDTGTKICVSVYGEYTPENWSKILKANNMNENSTYYPGQELIIP